MTAGLRFPAPGGRVTQEFGHSTLAVQPSMWRESNNSKAYWQRYPGADVFDANVHAGFDVAGLAAGSPLVAPEAGTVVRSEYDGDNGGGHVVEIEIRPGTRVSHNHCSARLVSAGQKVTKGLKVATIGATGTITMPDGTKVRSAYGVHDHFVLTIRERGSDGVTRTMLYNPRPFLEGGALAGDARIKPLAARIVHVQAGVNIRTSADLDAGSRNIYATSTPIGIYRAGTRIAPLTTDFVYSRDRSTDDGVFAEIIGFGRYLYVFKPLLVEF
jgi:hypothetical protein